MRESGGSLVVCRNSGNNVGLCAKVVCRGRCWFVSSYICSAFAACEGYLSRSCWVISKCPCKVLTEVQCCETPISVSAQIHPLKSKTYSGSRGQRLLGSDLTLHSIHLQSLPSESESPARKPFICVIPLSSLSRSLLVCCVSLEIWQPSNYGKFHCWLIRIFKTVFINQHLIELPDISTGFSWPFRLTTIFLYYSEQTINLKEVGVKTRCKNRVLIEELQQ